jgi:hypothetical protein
MDKKKREEPPPHERRLVQGVVSGKSVSRAARDAGYARSFSALKIPCFEVIGQR